MYCYKSVYVSNVMKWKKKVGLNILYARASLIAPTVLIIHNYASLDWKIVYKKKRIG